MYQSLRCLCVCGRSVPVSVPIVAVSMCTCGVSVPVSVPIVAVSVYGRR